MSALLEFDNVTVHRRQAGLDLELLGGLSLAVDEGDIVAVVGPSGSGKSTLLSLAAGFVTPTSGSVRFKGEDLASFSSERSCEYRNKDIGMVFQSFNLVPSLSAVDNAAMPAVIAGLPKRQAKELASALLAQVGMGDFAKSKVCRLSGGQQQRVAIARALVNGPSLILADEPTGNLDRACTASVLELLCEACASRGAALLVATHDDEVAQRAGRVVDLR